MSEPTGIAALGVNWKMLISQGVNFLLLVVLLKWLLYKPVLKLLNERQQKISDFMELAEKTKKEAAELEEKNRQKIDEAKKQVREYLEEAKTQAKEEAQKIHEDAQVEAKKFTDKARQEIISDREKMVRDLKSELADLILLASGKLTRKTIKPEIQKELVDEVIRDLKEKKL